MGFRPTVHRLANALGLDGWVRNGPDGVVIEIQGPPERVRSFAANLPRSLPPLARLDEYLREIIPPTRSNGFEVRQSECGPRRRALVPPDARICPECLAEMEDPDNPRYHYPFTCCTNCGPRFSLVRSLPYDRPATAMGCFPLCSDCAVEYRDPQNRRFHAEPVCCPECGPRLWCEGRIRATGAVALLHARNLLERGGILALKGLGGFQLACRADLEPACARLRRLKRRPSKPFAIMFSDLASLRQAVEITPEDSALLRGPRSPILLAPRRVGAPICDAAAPGISGLGVMLPTTPLHVELFRGLRAKALVMTSGNRGDEPICRGNREALERLKGIADLFLLHDRDVIRRVDDSVLRSSPGAPFLVRRSRGWIPDPLPLPEPTKYPLLAMGGHLQVTSCLALGSEAFLSQHIGDLDTPAARTFQIEVIEGLEDFLQAKPRTVVVDLHPDYPGTRLGCELAKAAGAGILRVQHHLAHLAGAAAEHSVFPMDGERIGGIVLDGTGWGPDGCAWGGEFLELRGDLRWRRPAHLEELPLVGCERAVREPWRVVVAALVRAGLWERFREHSWDIPIDHARREAVAKLAADGNWPLATGAGRLFEAAGALFGLCAQNRYEGEAALRFESLASSAPSADTIPPWEDISSSDGHRDLRGAWILASSNLLARAARRLSSGEDPARVAAAFHATFCALAARIARRSFHPSVHEVVLSGGCFINRLLRLGLTRELRKRGFEVFLPTRVPPGDGGLCYGQAVLGAVASERGKASRLVEAESCA